MDDNPVRVPTMSRDSVGSCRRSVRRTRRQASTAVTGGIAGASSPASSSATPPTISFATTSRWRFPTSWPSTRSTRRPSSASALTGLSIAYGISKFLMGSVSDRSNPRYFLPLGLLLSCAIMVVSGTVKAIYASLALIIVLQALNGWVQGMGWPPCGKTMVHWFSTQRARPRRLVVERRRTTSAARWWRRSRSWGVTLFGDWGAKFYFNALIAAVVAVVAFFLLRDTPQSDGLPPVEEYKNDYPPDYGADNERTLHLPRDLLRTRPEQPLSLGDRHRERVRLLRPLRRGELDSDLPADGEGVLVSANRASAGRSTSRRPSPARSRAAGCRTSVSRAAARRRRSCSWR